MKRILITAAILTVSGLAHAGNFATCLLDELPDVQNDAAARAAFQVCTEKHPAQYLEVTQGSGRGFFSYDSGAECALKKSRETRSQLAARMIRVACNRLYNEPNLFDDL